MIHQFLYGMFGDGKIYLMKTDGLNDVLTDKNLHFLAKLQPEDSDKYLWLPTEQAVALPHIVSVEDKDGRTWVQNQTLIVPIHDYIQLTNPTQLLSKFFLPTSDHPPERLEPLQVETK